jgi:hypothetical protein
VDLIYAHAIAHGVISYSTGLASELLETFELLSPDGTICHPGSDWLALHHPVLEVTVLDDDVDPDPRSIHAAINHYLSTDAVLVMVIHGNTSDTKQPEDCYVQLRKRSAG